MNKPFKQDASEPEGSSYEAPAEMEARLREGRLSPLEAENARLREALHLTRVELGRAWRLYEDLLDAVENLP